MSQHTLQEKENILNKNTPQQTEDCSDLRQILNKSGDCYREETDIPKSSDLNDLLSANYNNTHME